MPRHIRLLLCLTAVLTAFVPPAAAATIAGWQVLESSPQRLHLRIELPVATVETVDEGSTRYLSLSLPGFLSLAEPGLPLLPQQGAWIAVPPEGDASLRVTILKTERLPAGRLLPSATAEPPLPGEHPNPASVREVTVEGPGYATFRSGSGNLATLGQPVWSHGQRMAPLRLRPFLVSNPGAPVEQVTSLDLVVEFPAAGGITGAGGELDTVTLSRLLNPKVAAGWHTESPQTRLRRSSALKSAQLKTFPKAAAADQIVPMDQLTLLSDEYRIPVSASGLVRVHLADLFGTLGFPSGIRHEQLRLYQKRPSTPGSASYPTPLSVDVPFHFYGSPDPQSEIT